MAKRRPEAADDCRRRHGENDATESARRVIDRALQMFGGHGVSAANLESLYREIQPSHLRRRNRGQNLIVAFELIPHPSLNSGRQCVVHENARCNQTAGRSPPATPTASRRAACHSRRGPDRLEQGLEVRDRRFRRSGPADLRRTSSPCSPATTRRPSTSSR